MNKIITFQNRTVVVAHITSFYKEADDTIYITLSSGETLKEQFNEQERDVMISNLVSILSETAHI